MKITTHRKLRNRSIIVVPKPLSPKPKTQLQLPGPPSTDLTFTYVGGFPKLGVPSWGVPIIRIQVYWGLIILGPPFLGKLPFPCPLSCIKPLNPKTLSASNAATPPHLESRRRSPRPGGFARPDPPLHTFTV